MVAGPVADRHPEARHAAEIVLAGVALEADIPLGPDKGRAWLQRVDLGNAGHHLGDAVPAALQVHVGDEDAAEAVGLPHWPQGEVVGAGLNHSGQGRVEFVGPVAAGRADEQERPAVRADLETVASLAIGECYAAPVRHADPGEGYPVRTNASPKRPYGDLGRELGEGLVGADGEPEPRGGSQEVASTHGCVPRRAVRLETLWAC